jgi:hypothetical protein
MIFAITNEAANMIRMIIHQDGKEEFERVLTIFFRLWE